MFNQPFYMPGYASRMMPSIASGAINNMARGAMMPASTLNNAVSATGMASRGGGLFSKLGGALGAFKSFNWGGLINNTSKTLGIINQTIPLVRQVGPMFGNMKSMLRVASLFKDETDTNFNSNNSSSKIQGVNNRQNNFNTSEVASNGIDKKKEETSINYINVIDESPTFFIS